MIPQWFYAAGGLAIATIGFGAGWQVRAWKCDAAIAAELKKGIARGKEQQELVHLRAGQHAQESQDAAVATHTRETELRTIYRNVPVPAECEPPAVALGVLDNAIGAANTRAGGQPGTTMPTDRAAAEPVPRP